MVWKIFNIGKANERITALETEKAALESQIAALKAAPPAAGDSTAQLADALASNATISSALEKANADLAAANQARDLAESRLKEAGESNSQILESAKTACAELKLDVGGLSTATAMIGALKTGVSTTLAKLNVDPKAIPAGKPNDGGGKAEKPALKGLARMAASMRIEGIHFNQRPAKN